LTNLAILSLHSNQISDILTLSGLTNLTELKLSDNQISDISPLSGLTNLTYLQLKHNQINDISVLSELTNLTELWLNDNQISDVSPLSGLTSLWSLSLYNNPLNVEAYCTYLPLIEDNNPDIYLQYDTNPYPPEACIDDEEDDVPNGLFSIEGTRWGQCFIQLSSSEPHIQHECPGSLTMGFYQGVVYFCLENEGCHPNVGTSYIDLPMVSFIILPDDPPGGSKRYSLYMLNPTIGLGFYTWFVIFPENPWKQFLEFWGCETGIMFKIEDGWTPPEDEPSTE
jgi:hypothetical protein